MISLGCNVGAIAQGGGTFQAGLKIEPSINWFTVEADQPQQTQVSGGDAKIGFSYGAMLDYFFQENVGLGFEVRYNTISGNLKQTYPISSGFQTAEYKLKMDYVEVPLTLKMRTNEVGYMKYFGQFGFTPAINVRTRADIDSGNFSIDKVKIRERIRPYNLYLLLGLGAEYNLGGTTSLVGRISYNKGFIDQWTEDEDVRDVLLKHQYIGLSLGVLF